MADGKANAEMASTVPFYPIAPLRELLGRNKC